MEFGYVAETGQAKAGSAMTHSQFEQLSAYDRQHPDAPRSTSGSRPVIAGRPLRTSYSRSRRPLGGLAGRSWRSTATRASVAPGGATSGLDWMPC